MQIIDPLRCGFLDKLMVFVTKLGDGGFIWILFTVCMLMSRQRRKYGVMAAVALILGLLIVNGAIKPLCARPRPFSELSEPILLIPTPADYSFPSAHTMSSFAAAICIFFGSRRWGTAALTLAGLIAASRMYLTVHFPTDILGGLIFGIIFAFAARRITEKLSAHMTKKQK